MIHIQSDRAAGDHISSRVFEQNCLRHRAVAKPLVVRQTAAEQKRMHAWRPFVVVTSQEDSGLLQLAKMEAGRSVSLIIVLKEIALADILVFRLEKNRVLRRELEFYLPIGLGAGNLVVRSAPVVVLEFGVERIAEVAEDAEL